MKVLKKIIAVIVFCSFIVGSFYLVTAVSRVSSSDSDTRVKVAFEQFYEQEENSIDVVLFGSSAIYRDFISIESYNSFGFTSYSLATMSQPFKSVKYLIEETLKTQNPSLFVIEIRQLVSDVIREKYNISKDEEAVDEMKRFLANCMPFSYNRYKMIEEILPDDTFYSYFDFIRNHLKWSNMSFSLFCDHLFTSTSYETYIDMKCPNMISTCESYSKDFWSTEETYDIPQESLSVLEDLLTYIEQNNFNVLFVSTPFHQTENYKIAENSIGKYLSEKGYNYLNCNDCYDDIEIDFATDFYDERHANVLGALKITDYIGQYIISNYSITINHSKQVTSDWDNSYSIWDNERERLCEKANENAKEANL